MDAKQLAIDTFVHSGIISKIHGKSIIVSLDENVHCESCRAKGTCGISDSASKEIEIANPEGAFSLNEPVEVVLKKRVGLTAVFWAYIFPFILMVVTLVVASLYTKEWISGLLSLLVLAPYYLMLYALKNVFQRAFKISISKIDFQ